MEPLDDLSVFLEEIDRVLFQVFQSGFSSVHDSTLEELKELSDEAEDYGLFYAKEALDQIWESLSESRHTFLTDFSGTVKIYSRMERYLSLAKRRIELMQVREQLDKKKIV